MLKVTEIINNIRNFLHLHQTLTVCLTRDLTVINVLIKSYFHVNKSLSLNSTFEAFSISLSTPSFCTFKLTIKICFWNILGKSYLSLYQSYIDYQVLKPSLVLFGRNNARLISPKGVSDNPLSVLSSRPSASASNCKQAQKKQSLPSFTRTLGGFFVLYNTLSYIAITAYFLL